MRQNKKANQAALRPRHSRHYCFRKISARVTHDNDQSYSATLNKVGRDSSWEKVNETGIRLVPRHSIPCGIRIAYILESKTMESNVNEKIMALLSLAIATHRSPTVHPLVQLPLNLRWGAGAVLAATWPTAGVESFYPSAPVSERLTNILLVVAETIQPDFESGFGISGFRLGIGGRLRQ